MDARNDQASTWGYRVPGRELHLWGAALTGAGCERIRPGDAYPLHGHPGAHDFSWERGRLLPFLQMLVCTQGGGRFESGPSGGLDLAAGDVVLMVPGIRHRYRPASASGWTAYWLEFTGPVPERLIHEAAIEARRPALRGIAATIEVEIAAVVALALDPAAAGAHVAMAGMAVLAHAIAAAPLSADAADQAVEAARDRLADGNGATANLRQLAKESGQSYASFRRRFTATVGMPPRHWEILARLGRAREMLAGGASVATAASACGFASPFYFSRRFKATFGVSPSACIP